MPYNIVREIKLSGSETFSVVGEDVIIIKVRGDEAFKYKVPTGRSGTVKITIESTLQDQEDA